MGVVTGTRNVHDGEACKETVSLSCRSVCVHAPALRVSYAHRGNEWFPV